MPLITTFTCELAYQRERQALYHKLGLVATQASDSVGYTILNAFGLIVSSPEKAYEVGFGVFNMLGAVVQFFGVIFLSGFLANRFGKKSVFIVCLALTAVFTAFFYFPNPHNSQSSSS